MKMVFKPLIDFFVDADKHINVLLFPIESFGYHELLVFSIDHILKIL